MPAEPDTFDLDNGEPDAKRARVEPAIGPTNPLVCPLLTDLYQLTMPYAYWRSGRHKVRGNCVIY